MTPYLARAAAQALSTNVYVTLTGDWLSEETGNRGADEHALAPSAYLDSVAPDTILARVRGHAETAKTRRRATRPAT